MPREFSPSYRLVVRLVRPVLRATTRRDWRGAQHLPADGFVAVSNHLSYSDPFTLAHFLVDHGIPPRFLAKEAVFELPVAGRIVRGAGQIPVRRGSVDAARALQAAVDAVRAGECVAVYTDGTLTRDPGLWPMTGKTGAARIALSTGAPVIPIAQWGAQELLEPYGKRPHLLRRPTVHVWAGPPVDLSPWQDRPLDAGTLNEATAAIVGAVTGLLEQIRGERAPARVPPLRRHDGPLTGDWRHQDQQRAAGGGEAR
jgi:1-acyl-sn-glycerol-3-phosphate acyltransferase